jgi:hypothetical protein
MLPYLNKNRRRASRAHAGWQMECRLIERLAAALEVSRKIFISLKLQR